MFEDLEPRAARGAPLVALTREDLDGYSVEDLQQRIAGLQAEIERSRAAICLLYTSPSPRDRQKSRMPSSA